ncbi:MAG: hypothetical protein FJZ90_00045 [Chloroflexi bacterium]|nr:hypothetical protein [Chloroflexota bacterium]
MATYATILHLRQYLTQVKAGAENDLLLQAILDRAHAIVNDTLGFEFAGYGATATTRDVQSLGGYILRPQAYEAGTLTAIASVWGRGTTSETTETVEDWLAEEQMRPYQVYRNAGWAYGRWYRLTACWGYGAAPASVVEVELEAAINLWRGRDAAVWQAETGVEGAGATPLNRALSWPQRDVLNAVRAQYLGVVHA